MANAKNTTNKSDAEEEKSLLISDSTIRIFISYRNIHPSDSEASALASALWDVGFKTDNVFYDQTRLKAGDIWMEKIFENVRQSDVLIVLLQAGQDGEQSTAESDWVQREVDVARGSHVSILPIKLVGETEILITSQVAELLAIRDRQFLEYGSQDSWIADFKKRYYEKFLSENKNSALEQNYEMLSYDEKRKLHEDYYNDHVTDDEKQQIIKDAAAKQKSKFKELIELIVTLCQRTRIQQRKWMSELQRLRRRDHAKNNPSVAQFAIDTSRTLHIATGDLTEFTNGNIDVIVNSENDYMQLARMFEINSLSVTLRIRGSYFVNGRLMDDRIQNELNEQVRLVYKDQGLPVMLGEVIATHAGHPYSELVKNKNFRYIFHAATIHFDAIFSDVPLTSVNSTLGITTVVKNCLDKVEAVNLVQGQILHPQSIYNDDQEDTTAYHPIKSIIFPMFATGQAGRPVDKVIEPILVGIKEWFDHHPETTLTDVYISVFVQDHLPIVETEIKQLFKPKAN